MAGASLLPTHWPPQRTLARAAIRHFVIAENAEGDFHVVGLDDDELVTSGVLEHFGMTPARRLTLQLPRALARPNVCN